MFGVDNSLETSHLVVCCDVGQLIFDVGFRACYTSRLSECY